jgi:hypothetical protein
MQKTLSEISEYIKILIPADIPKNYQLKAVLTKISNEDNIRSGVLAFRDFLYQLYDCLIADGRLYEAQHKKAKNEKSGHGNVASLAVGYPFLNNITSVLINIGYYGKIAKNGDSIMFSNLQSLTSVIGAQGGHIKQNISAVKVIESLKFLTSCGIYFDGIDLEAKKPNLAKINLLEISYPDNPIMLTGLKVMAIAHNELSTKNDYYIFQRCDYRALRKDDLDITALLNGFIRPLPAKTQKFILNLHQHYIDAGLVCKMKNHFLGIYFSYSYKSNILWDYTISPDGCRIFIKAKNTDKYADVIKKFPLSLQKKISKGYGCEKKRFGEPCQKGCHGFSFALDDSILDISRDIEVWIDKELSFF